MTFQEKINKFMVDNKYTSLNKLAKDSKIPYTTLRDFYARPNLDNAVLSTIKKLSEFMKCTLDYLVYDEILDPNGYGKSKEDDTLLTKDDKDFIQYMISKRKKEKEEKE